MSEKVYAWLLRLYPSSFQERYGEEALQLFRDRARDERGFSSGLRLWLDLLGDLAISVPRAYRDVPAGVVVSAPRGVEGAPSFRLLEKETLSFLSLLYGGFASLAVYSSILILIGHAGNAFAVRTSGFLRAPRPRVVIAAGAALTSGSIVSITATVLAVDAGPTPTGNVRFFDDSTALDIGALSGGTATIRRKLPRSSTHSLSAIYYGDNNYSPSSTILIVR